MPLLTVSEERKEEELRRARDHAEPLITRRSVLLTLMCFGWMLLGWFLLGLSFHLSDPERAQAAFLAALLVANGGPAWTLVLAHWHKHER